MESKHVLGAVDYVAICLSLIVSALIGVVFQKRQNTTKEYLLAGKNAPIFAVVMSTTATSLSAISMLGNPAETYRYGPQSTIAIAAFIFGIISASRIFIPVFFRCNVSSIYEYLELRFGKLTRYTVSAMFILQMVLYSSSVLYGPSLALSAVSNISFEVSVILCGTVCTLYCFLGGLRAVLWTDVFQSLLMVLCLLVIYIVGISEIGGFGEMFTRANKGNRLNFFEMKFDFTTRLTFWNCNIRGFLFGLSFYGTSQIEMQRSLSMSSIQRAQKALQISSVVASTFSVLCHFFGLVLYAVFYLCDPVMLKEETGITKYDQMVPYYIVTRLKAFPGLTGLCIAGLFSGSLSTISSSLNSISTVATIDFIKPIFGSRMNDSRLVFVAKGLTLFFGVLFVCFAFILANVDSIVYVVSVFIALVEGPILAVFLVGVLTRKISDKAAMFGLLIGCGLITWIGLGGVFSGHTNPSLPLESNGCSSFENRSDLFANTSLISSSTVLTSALTTLLPKQTPKEIFVLYKIAYSWLPVLGFFFTLIALLIIGLIADKNKNMIPSDSKYLSPVVRYWMKNTYDNKELETKYDCQKIDENAL